MSQPKYTLSPVDPENDVMRLCVFDEQGALLDIVEGPTRFMLQWVIDLELPNEGLRIRKVKR